MLKLCPNCRCLHGTGKLGPGMGIVPRTWCVKCAKEKQTEQRRTYLAEISLADMLDWLLDSELPGYVEEYVANIHAELVKFGRVTSAEEDLIRRTYAKAQSQRYSRRAK